VGEGKGETGEGHLFQREVEDIIGRSLCKLAGHPSRPS
jgi:hypothetical protein